MREHDRRGLGTNRELLQEVSRFAAAVEAAELVGDVRCRGSRAVIHEGGVRIHGFVLARHVRVAGRDGGAQGGV